MKKIVFLIMSFMAMVGLSAQINELRDTDTGILVQFVEGMIPLRKIEIINPTCVVGMTINEDAGDIPIVDYAYWTGNCGITESTLGFQLEDTSVVNIMVMFDENVYSGAKAVKEWIKLNAPKDDKLLESEIRRILKETNSNDSDYILFRAEESKVKLGKNIVFIYCTKSLARRRGIID